MGRILGPKCRICRREGIKLYLKATKCETVKCPVERRNSAPGQQAQRRRRLTDFGLHLREYQKVKRYYGVLARQFRKYFQEAARLPGNTGENLLILLERRLDNVLYRLGLGLSRTQSRQLIQHGHVLLNRRRVTIPSVAVRPGDVIEPGAKDASRKLLAENAKQARKELLPSWLKYQEDPLQGFVIQFPTRAEVPLEIREHLVVEYCSR